MANKRTCPACGAPVSPGEEFCSYCGALVPHNEAAAAAQSAQAVQSAPAPQTEREKRRVQTPQTIEELLAFCQRHELPLAKMRFFIGLDYPGAKAYGIFKDKNGEFVVYKNKADGSRAVRYRGPDEAHAVGELFAKLKEEATGQRARFAAARTPGRPVGSAGDGRSVNYSSDAASQPRRSSRKPNKLLIGIIALAAAITIGRTAAYFGGGTQKPAAGYYNYNDTYYYNQNDSWYYYDDGWFPIYSVDDELTQNAQDYFSSYSYSDDYGVENFYDSGLYDGGSSYSDGWVDSGSDWDSSDDSWSSSDYSWDWDDDDSWDSSDDWDWDSDWDSDWGDWDSDW